MALKLVGVVKFLRFKGKVMMMRHGVVPVIWIRAESKCADLNIGAPMANSFK